MRPLHLTDRLAGRRGIMPQKPDRPEQYNNIIDEFYAGGNDAPGEPDDTKQEQDTDVNADRVDVEPRIVD